MAQCRRAFRPPVFVRHGLMQDAGAFLIKPRDTVLQLCGWMRRSARAVKFMHCPSEHLPGIVVLFLRMLADLPCPEICNRQAIDLGIVDEYVFVGNGSVGAPSFLDNTLQLTDYGCARRHRDLLILLIVGFTFRPRPFFTGFNMQECGSFRITFQMARYNFRCPMPADRMTTFEGSVYLSSARGSTTRRSRGYVKRNTVSKAPSSHLRT
jgi:hypothetical protein